VRRARAPACNSHGKNPIASQLVTKLRNGGKRVVEVNPGMPSGTVKGSLRDATEPIEVVDLVINPAKGFAVVEEMASLNIKVNFHLLHSAVALTLFKKKQELVHSARRELAGNSSPGGKEGNQRAPGLRVERSSVVGFLCVCVCARVSARACVRVEI